MRYVALLRGINVGGATMMKMDDLKAEFRKLGFQNVVSYINSGNFAFDAEKASESKLVKIVEGAIEERFGRKVAVMIRAQSEIESILTENPFDGQYGSHKEMHVLFLKDEMPGEKRRQLIESALEGERYEVRDREVYCHLPNGVAESLLSKGFFERKMNLSATARNWRTVVKLGNL